MHLLVRETRLLDEAEAAVDLGQTPADVVLLSFTDSDLGAVAAAWEGMAERDRPTLRLASLSRLRHPMSVDLYLDAVLSRARCVVLRLLGGLDYWRYGTEELSALCRRGNIALAALPGDDRDDPRLRELSNVPAAQLARLDALLRRGGPDNLRGALRLAGHLAGRNPDDAPAPVAVPAHGEHVLPARDAPDGAPVAAVVFYRSHLLAGDAAPVEALAAALRARGMAPRLLFVGSLKDPASAGFVAERLRAWRPAVVLNATGFSARRGGEGPDAGSPLDAAGVPVLQAVLSGGSREAWAASARGLSQTDLAMQVVLPELDGRLLCGAIAFKAEQEAHPGLEYARTVLRPDPDGIALAADRAAGWARLAASPPGRRRIAVVLSDYPAAGGQVGHAVGLDGFASLSAILADLRAIGDDVGDAVPDPAALVRALCDDPPAPWLGLDEYRALYAALPAALRARIEAAWGPPEADPSVRNGCFHLRHARAGRVLMAVQPDRGAAIDRAAGYHDPDSPPRHGFVAFYLALRHRDSVDAMVHLGAHGTLEWLPGKATALSADCAPAALIGGLPVVYPFIVNNPGEAAVAKRRLGAVTVGHGTPPLRAAGSHGAAPELERMLDEYAAADGLDRRRTAMLRRDILDAAGTAGLLAESGAAPGDDEEDALARLDAFLCDVKEMQIRDGLHVFGRDPAPERRAMLLDALARANPAVPVDALAARLDASAAAERDGLRAALAGRFVPPGPAGAPTRGRADVLPTGRNLFAVDPRAVPTPAAEALAAVAAAELLRRHRQDHGDWPRALVIDLWGSAALRTGGEDLALALALIGARTLRDAGSGRVTGVEILPVALLDRPRVDVTLRISGLFRDAFAEQVLLFDDAVRAVAARDEEPDWNPLAGAARGLAGEALRRATARVFGAAPGAYGTGAEAPMARGADAAALGAAYLAGSGHAYGRGLEGAADAPGFAARVAAAEAFVHVQDHREVDLLDGPGFAAHEAGFAAAAALLGAAPALYHPDTSDPGAPVIRTLAEELVRTVRGRVANPAWIAGMTRHGYRGAAEMARALDGLHGFAAGVPFRLDAQFDLVFDATLGDPDTDGFLRRENPAARAAMAVRFADALRRGLWRPRRNAAAALLDGEAAP